MSEFGRKPIASVSEGYPGAHPAIEKHFSVSEVAELWNLSERTIRRIFADEPGVMLWGREETLHKRGYMTMRIPESVVERVHRRLRKTG